jgi:hypothetical protein
MLPYLNSTELIFLSELNLIMECASKESYVSKNFMAKYSEKKAKMEAIK